MIKIAKDENGNYDLVLENGEFKMVENSEAVVVHLMERLLLDRTEALNNPLIDTKKNPLAGMDWNGIIFDATKSTEEKYFEIARVVLSTPDVRQIILLNFEVVNKTLKINLKVDTIYGEVTIDEVLSPNL
jgi:hypothetical protein